MKSFISKYLFLLIWIGAIAGIGGLFVYVYQLNSHLVPLNTYNTGRPTPNAAPPAPPAPSINLTLQTVKGKNKLTITWANLPANTVGLNIYRGKTGTSSSTWSLWRTMNIPGGLTNGQFQIDLGKGSQDGYSFYVQAVSNGSDTGNQGGGGGGTVVWTSDITVPGTGNPTSTNQQPPTGSSSTNNGGQNNASGTNQNPPPAPPAPAPAPAGTPSGTPYYSPKVQISGYGADQNANFWVQHVDQKIQIGWQNLPAGTDSVVIYRSPNQDGPWTTVLTQENPGTSYSIQVVDNTLGVPFYYEMNAVDGSTTVATYGPVFLAAQ